VIDRGKYLQRQRRYNQSEKGHARYARSNAKRIFVGETYYGRAPTAEIAEDCNLYASAMLAEFKAKQREEYRAKCPPGWLDTAWRDSLESSAA